MSMGVRTLKLLPVFAKTFSLCPSIGRIVTVPFRTMDTPPFNDLFNINFTILGVDVLIWIKVPRDVSWRSSQL